MADLDTEAPEAVRSTPLVNREPVPSAIEELQSAFPTLLLLEKDKTKALHEKGYNSGTSYLYPFWNGSFALLSFPREIRDLIYFHYLYRSHGFTWCRRPNHGWIHRYPHGYVTVYRGGMTDVLSLFLVSRQVYQEALYMFCSSNVILVEKRPKFGALEGALRLFPEPAASMLQRVETVYNDNDKYLYEVWDGPRSSGTWEIIVRDALAAKEHLPRLTEYTALWDLDWRHFYEYEGMGSLQQEDEEVKVLIWLSWLERHSKARGVVPPRWLKVRFGPKPQSYHYQTSSNNHQKAWDRALIRFEEVRVREEEKGVALENSGKKWLEERWGDRKRLRKKSIRRYAM
jgi:hypothetical protein